MKNLSKLRPAETIVTLEGRTASLKELLKLTFLDLLLKQILETTIVEKEYTSRDTRHYKYITRGRNLMGYSSADHENVYLSPFRQSSSIRVMLQHLVKMGFQNSKSRSNYISTIGESENIAHCFSKNILQKFFGGFSLNAYGKELKHELEEEIVKLEKDLPAIISSDRNKAQEILNRIGGNIFILKTIDVSLLAQIDPEILSELKRKYRSGKTGGGSSASGDSGCYGCSSFDSGCSGCSSSGCSGCSGCGGGCGGCGGD